MKGGLNVNVQGLDENVCSALLWEHKKTRSNAPYMTYTCLLNAQFLFSTYRLVVGCLQTSICSMMKKPPPMGLREPKKLASESLQTSGMPFLIFNTALTLIYL